MSAPEELERISVREFARRDHCDEKLVRRAVGRGFLPKSSDKLLPAFLVGTGWRETNRRRADTQRKPASRQPGPVRKPAPVRLHHDEPRDGGYVDGLLDLARSLPALLRAAAAEVGVAADTAQDLAGAFGARLTARVVDLLDAEGVAPVVLIVDDEEMQAVTAADTWAAHNWLEDGLEPAHAD